MPTRDKTDDAALARALIAGEDGAFERFVEVFRGKIFQYSLLMCGHREDAEEVAQDTLMKVFNKLDQLDDPERIRAWVFRIAKNACLMKRRKSVFAPTQELSLDDFLPHAHEDGGARKLDIADWRALPDDQVLRGELQSVVKDAIQELPDIYRSVILLRDIEELTTEEAAQVLEVSQEVVKTRLHRARLAMRQKLDAYLKSAQARTN